MSGLRGPHCKRHHWDVKQPRLPHKKNAGKRLAFSGVSMSINEVYYFIITNSSLLFFAQAASSLPCTAGFSLP